LTLRATAIGKRFQLALAWLATPATRRPGNQAFKGSGVGFDFEST
jgi:hypothetical protein